MLKTKHILTLTLISLMVISLNSAAADVDYYFNGSGTFGQNVSNANSELSLFVSANSTAGEFHSTEGPRGGPNQIVIESDSEDDSIPPWASGFATGTGVVANYTGTGVASATQKHDLVYSDGIYDGTGTVTATSNANRGGFVDIATNTHPQTNDLRTTGYGDYTFGGSGTDEPLVGADGTTGSFAQITASFDDGSGGDPESFYSANVSLDDGQVGMGTWKAGGNQVLNASWSGTVNGDVLVYGSGNGSVTQSFTNVGNVDFESHWD